MEHEVSAEDRFIHRVKARLYRETKPGGKFSRDILAAPVFLIEAEDAGPLIEESKNKRLRLPADPMVLALPTLHGGIFFVAASKGGQMHTMKSGRLQNVPPEECVALYACSWDKEGNDTLFGRVFRIPQLGGIQSAGTVQGVQAIPLDQSDADSDSWIVGFFAASLLLLTEKSSNEDKVLPASIRGSMRLRGQSGFTYKKVIINPQPQGKSEPQGGTHASPRWHLRRGHYRRHGDKIIWIRPSEVGSKEQGIVHHDYTFEGGD